MYLGAAAESPVRISPQFPWQSINKSFVPDSPRHLRSPHLHVGETASSANDVGHLVKSAIIHLLHSMQDPPLHRLQTIIDVWHRPLQNYIRSVVQKYSWYMPVRVANPSGSLCSISGLNFSLLIFCQNQAAKISFLVNIKQI